MKKKEDVPSVFLPTIIILVLALVAAVVPLLVRQGGHDSAV